MASSLIIALITASTQPGLTHTTYGWGEHMCGDPHAPSPCDTTATTASGLPFHPDEPHVAIHVPSDVTGRVRLRPGRWTVCFRHVRSGTYIHLPITDKKGKKGGLDFSPGALRLLGIHPTPWWSGTLTPCSKQQETTK
jgi:hypothetical protein